MADWMGQRITPDDVCGTYYCKRHQRIASEDDGCEQCFHEYEAAQEEQRADREGERVSELMAMEPNHLKLRGYR